MKIRIVFVTILLAYMTVQGCTAANGQTEGGGYESRTFKRRPCYYMYRYQEQRITD